MLVDRHGGVADREVAVCTSYRVSHRGGVGAPGTRCGSLGADAYMAEGEAITDIL